MCLVCLLGSAWSVIMHGIELMLVPAYFSCIPYLLLCLVRHRPGAWQNPERGGCGREQVQLDGAVRTSGTGVPPWERWLGELPELDSLQTRLTDGVGTSS